MATTTWAAFLPHIIPETKGLAEPLAELHIREAIIDFCARSYCWVIDHDPFDAEVDENVYDLLPPTKTMVARIMRVWYDKNPLEPRSVSWLSQEYGDYMQAEGRPEHFLQERHSQLIVVPKPSEDLDEGFTAKIAIKPTREATGVEAVIADRHFDSFVHAAKARLFGMSKQPWSDPTLALYYVGMVEQEVARARLDVTRGLVSGRMRTLPQYF